MITYCRPAPRTHCSCSRAQAALSVQAAAAEGNVGGGGQALLFVSAAAALAYLPEKSEFVRPARASRRSTAITTRWCWCGRCAGVKVMQQFLDSVFVPLVSTAHALPSDLAYMEVSCGRRSTPSVLVQHSSRRASP